MKKLYFLIVAMFVGLAASAQYGSPLYAVGDFDDCGWDLNSLTEFEFMGDHYTATLDNCANFKISTNGAADWDAFNTGALDTGGEKLKSGETLPLQAGKSDISLTYTANWVIDVAADLSTITATAVSEAVKPTVVYIMGLDGDWAEGLAAEVNAETNCAVWNIDAWAEGSEFKFKVGSSWYGYTGEVVSGEWYETGATGMVNTTLPVSANGQAVVITFAVDNNNFKAEWESSEEPVDPEDPEDPTEPTVVYLMGLDGDWAEGLAAEVNAETNCAVWNFDAWAEGSEFKFKVGDNWYGYTGEVVSGEWNETGDTGMVNTTLPASANGQAVVITFAVDNNNFKAEWESSEEPVDPEEPTVVYLMGLDGDWAEGLAAEVNAETNCAVWNFDAWAEGSEFKFKVGDNWYGYTGAVVSGEWYETGDTGMVNTTLPASANGQAVVITFAVDNNNFKAEWESSEEPVDPELPELYLRGEFNEWGTTDKFENDGTTYTITVASMQGGFKIANGDWSLDYGADAHGMDAPDGYPVEANATSTFYKGSCNAIAADLWENVTIEFVYTAGNAIDVKISADVVGVENVAVEANEAAEYYNLQGVRVANPENGLYIVRRGNSVAKVMIR